MKFCARPWIHWYLVDAEIGEVWPCGWMDSRFNLGNILTQEIDEILQSEELKKLRESILDGSFRYCDCHKCNLIANDKLPDLSEEEINEITSIKYPHEFNIAYDETCNHACSSCRHEFFKGTKEYYEKVEYINQKMLPYYNKATRISINGRGDIFACEHLLTMLEKLKPEREDFKLVIETNGALFDEAHWNRIAHLSKYHIRVIVTINSFHDSTYRYLNGYSNHVDKVLDNLKFMRSLRDNGKINDFEISAIAQESNFREIPEYVERCLNEFGADSVRIRGIMNFIMDEDEFWFKDVFNPAHPFYKEAIDILHHPIMQDKRVWYWEGDYEHGRKPVKRPISRYKEYYDILWKMCELDDKGMLAESIEKYAGKKIALYGAGHLTEYLSRKMIQYGMKPCCIYDKNRQGICINEIPVYRISDKTEAENIDIIINTLSFYEEDVRKCLDDICFKGDIINIEELLK